MGSILSLVKEKPVRIKEQRLNFKFSPTVANVESGLNSGFEVSCDSSRNLTCLVVEISHLEQEPYINFVKSINPTLENGRKKIRIYDRVTGELVHVFGENPSGSNPSFDEYETHNEIKVGDTIFNYLVKLEDMKTYEIHSPDVDEKIEKIFQLVKKGITLNMSQES